MLVSGKLLSCANCLCIADWLLRPCRGSLRTIQISHLLVYPSLWLLDPGLSSQSLALLSIQSAFNVRGSGQYL